MAISIVIYSKCNESAREVGLIKLCLLVSVFAITYFSF